MLNEQDSIIQTEMEILQSLDVIMEAVQTIGAEKILAVGREATTPTRPLA